MTRDRRDYYQQNKEYITEVHRAYRESNREKINETARIKYSQRIDEIHEKRKETITCECGCEVRKDGLARHKRTIQHQKLTAMKRPTDHQITKCDEIKE